MDIISEFLNGTRYFAYWHNSTVSRYGNQIPVHNKDEVITLIEKYNGIENCGISISTFKKGVPFLLILPFDFDHKELKKPFEDASRLYNFLVDANYSASLNFSGKKGFHVLLKTEPLIYTKHQLREIQEFFIKYLSLKYADLQLIGDIRRIIRIPGTYNTSGYLAKEIASNEGKLFNLNDFTENVIREPLLKPITNGNGLIHPYPCVIKYLKDKNYWLEHHPRHSYEPHWILRFAYAIEELNNNKSPKEITDEMSSFGWYDFDYDTTLYFVNYIREKRYVHPSCDTLRELGFCLKNCVYNRKFEVKKNGTM